ncbi:potassium ion transporter [Ascoidea rubescens DSM 1968]|uniref:Potassium transport protein n=1 Tax=Ascoidea rubescens DSM 1968 TaxID=1344418 RepID=A0A1D2V967_9ASCO|nr:potassium transport protein TRK1/TRK2 [Ascoidea rubescens DSM 1968]ODV58190.1 potassium transport protein TRK1/TRK2 [Ascoidea rubescens DSM 1968]
MLTTISHYYEVAKQKLLYLSGKSQLILNKLFPSFIAVHYGYILTLTFLGSILLYAPPMSDKSSVHSISYIDALFFSACACTQAGLNTIDLNELSLFQQITIYILCMITTPIFIHSSVCVIRLYWFEKFFDNIKFTSKLNHKMRRSNTLAQRINLSNSTNKNIPLHNLNLRNPTLTNELTPNKNIPNTSAANITSTNLNNGNSNEINNQDNQDNHNNDFSTTNQNRDIKFAENLPHPSKAKKARQNFNPEEFSRSIQMLKNNLANQPINDEDDGPALIINGPAEREEKLKKKNLNLNLHKSRSNTLNKLRSRANSYPFKPWNKFKKYNNNNNNNNNINKNNHDDSNDKSFDISKSPIINTDIQNNNNKNTDLQINTPNISKFPSATFDKLIKDKLNKIKKKRRRHRRNNDESSKPPKIRTYSTKSITNYIKRTQSGDSSIFDGDNNNNLKKNLSANYLSWNPTIGRNSTFVDLTEQQKEELGGVEYRAIKLLVKILITYYVGFHIMCLICILPYISTVKDKVTYIHDCGVSVPWWGFFTSASVFNNLGMTLTPDSMVSFSQSAYFLIICSLFIVIGNTGFPILLRFIIWVLFKFAPDLSLFKESLGFLLDNPRRCFTLLFPRVPTLWLLFVLVTLNLIDVILFIILDLSNEAVESIPVGYRIIDAFFQAFSTRTAGFSVVDLAKLHPSVQVSYMLMMYISVLPLAISIRRTNVYEEQSLGVYYRPDDQSENEDLDKKPTTFIGTHLRKQLSYDLWFIFIGLFIICIAEGGRLSNLTQTSFTIFQVLFEIVSAYGTVGLSLGYPGESTSFSSQFTTVSKLVIICMVIRGRHRGLPYAIDRAITLPSERLLKRDEVQANHVLSRGNTHLNLNSRLHTNNTAA